MTYLSIFLNLRQRPVLVIGGGNVATRKIKLLMNMGAKIKVVTRDLCPELATIEKTGNITWIGNCFQPKMLDNIFLVISASNDTTLNAIVAEHANQRNLLLNTVDDPSHCSFIFPAIIDRSPIIIAISSGGTSPMMVRILRENFESIVPLFLGPMANLVGSWRNKVKQKIFTTFERHKFWKKIFNSYFIDLVVNNKLIQAEQFLKHTLDSYSKSQDN